MKDGADREHFAFEKRHQFSSSDIPGAAVVSQMCSAETEPKGPKVNMRAVDTEFVSSENVIKV